MARETSVEAYVAICENGTLSRMKRVTYDLLFKYGPATANHIMAKFKEENPGVKHQTIETVGRTLSFLVQDGIAKELGKVRCSITDVMVIQWDVTSALPGGVSKADKLDKKISQLEAKCARLKVKRDGLVNKILEGST